AHGEPLRPGLRSGPVRRMSARIVLAAAASLLVWGATAQKAPPAAAPEPQPQAQPSMPSAAERVYESAKPRILQVRTVLQAAGRQSSIGSGFLVTADGLAITNNHVGSQYGLAPKTYPLE